MNRSRSPSRRGPGRPKGSTRKKDPSSTDHESVSVNTSQRSSKRMRLVSPSTPPTSRASSAQPRRHKNLTATRRAVMTFFIESAQESPKKNGKVGSLQWMGEVLKVVNKAAKQVTDRVTNLDVIWWLEKHFNNKNKDLPGPFRPPWSQSREGSSSSELEEEENGRSGFRAESSDEASTDIEEPAEGEAENVPPEAVGNVREEVVIVPEAVIALDKVANASEVAADSQAEAEEAPESAAIPQGVSSSASVKLAAANVEAPEANFRPASSADEATAAPSPQVIDPDNESHEGGRKESGHDTLAAESGTDGDGEPVFRALEVIPPENPSEGVCLEGGDPAAGRQKAAVNPHVQNLEIQMVALNLQLNMPKEDRRYSEQVEVLTAQSKAMTAMISLLHKI